jgi:hypothetical protein
VPAGRDPAAARPGATRAGAAVDTPAGRIAVEWATADDAAFEFCVDLPPGVTADVSLPDGTAATATGGFNRFVTGLP